MSTFRSRVGVAVVENKLYAFGGYDGTSRLSTVECYDPQVNCSSVYSFLDNCPSVCVVLECNTAAIMRVCVCIFPCSLMNGS